MQREQPASLRQYYETLHLREGAPRDLVEEAYWFLIARAKREEMGEPAFSRHIAELNRAYEAISSSEAPPRRAQRRRENRRAAVWSRRTPVIDHRNFYEKLEVAYTADEEIVRIAARVLLAENDLGLRDRDWRTAIQHARDVLSDTERRLAYDASIGLVIVEDAPGAEAAADQPAASADEGARAEAEAVPAAAVSTERQLEAVAPATVPVAETTAVASVARQPTRVDAGAVEDRRPVRTATHKPSPNGGSGHEVAAGRERKTHDGELAGHHGPPPWRPIAQALSRGREEKAHQTEAANDRLLALRDAPPAVAASEMAVTPTRSPRTVEPPPADEAAGPRLRLVSGGEAGSSILLGSDAADDDSEGAEIELGGEADATVRIRVWRRDGQYLLQHVEGPPVSIGGETLVLPIVVLDDGDVISAGETVARFELGATAAASAATAVDK